jgi:sortase B
MGLPAGVAEEVGFMAGRYVIGNEDFKDEKHYQMGLRDLKRINKLKEKYDWNNPEDAAALMYCLREGSLRLETVQFRRALEKKLNACLGESKKRGQRKANKRNMVVRLAGVGCIVASLVMVGVYGFKSYREQKSMENMVSIQVIHSMQPSAMKEMMEAGTQEAQTTGNAQAEENAVMLQEFEELYGMNNDLAGWIMIDGTDIDYPIMQCGDNEYYLSHDFYGNDDSNGMLFFDYRNNLKSGDTNMIIYGHNMRSGKMFGNLLKYQDKDYYEAHRTMYVSTLYKVSEYRIIAVCQGKVAKKNDDVFRYYNFINPSDAEEFEEFRQNTKEQALFTMDEDMAATDSYITLSTCSDYVENGRLYIIAKKVREQAS